MSDNIGQMIGSSIQALPLDSMFKAPALAMAEAQKQLSYNYLEWVKNVGLDEDGSVKMVNAKFTETVMNQDGTKGSTITREVSVPLLSIVSHPNVNIKDGSVEFEMTIQASEQSLKETAGEGSLEAKVGWGVFSAKFSAKVSHKSSQTRSTDTRARYAVNMHVAQEELPEGMHRFLEIILNASSQPVKIN